MKTSTVVFRTLSIAIFLFSCTFSMALSAHQVDDPNGKSTHQHVYKRNSYGQGATAGHFAKPAGSNGIVLWQAAPSRSYAKPQPGFKVPNGHTKQSSQKQMYQQKPVFNKNQNRVPNLDKK
jgi:hypothetical protein